MDFYYFNINNKICISPHKIYVYKVAFLREMAIMMWLSTCMVIAQGRQLVTSFTIEFGEILSLSCEQNQPSKNNDLFGRFIAKTLLFVWLV